MSGAKLRPEGCARSAQEARKPLRRPAKGDYELLLPQRPKNVVEYKCVRAAEKTAFHRHKAVNAKARILTQQY